MRRSPPGLRGGRVPINGRGRLSRIRQPGSMTSAGRTKIFRSSQEKAMEKQKNSLAMISQPRISKRPGIQSSDAIRQFLVKAGEVYGRQITAPLVSIWIEALASYRLEVLEGLFRQVVANCKFFPTPADVLEPMKKAEEAGAPLAAEKKWCDVLEFCRLFV